MLLDKSKLGNRYACFQCGTKFYDLNRPSPTCPECGADQSLAPVRDIKSLLSGRSRVEDEDDENFSDSSFDPDEDEDEDDGFDGDGDMDEEGGGEEEESEEEISEED